ncbi:MAG: tetratricopeptide repeat protein [Gemmatimonadetes bacterium]|nr:tetratricopeptide repeat protein [Gemmatimonadota bacterium]NIO30946.1 tetratricopeptide repeat protein [Gemmatimonadota bacterium]
MPGQLSREVVRRRIPQFVGVYLAAGWGLLEFTDWAMRRFAWTVPVTDYVVGGLLLGLPLVVYTAWTIGGRAATARSLRKAKGGAKSIVVLPFANFGNSPDNEYLSDGITEEIINALTRVEGLSVVSRTSAFAYKGKSEDVRRIGRQLDVEAVLEGSVQVVGDRLRVMTQLVDVAGGFHLWSERFDREMEDVFAIEDEIAENVVRALRLFLREDERRALAKLPTSNVKAYEYYLRGRQFFHQSRKKGLEFAREMFRRAIEADPEYALAYAGIADASSLILMYYPSSEGNLEQADIASRKALELDPDLPEAHAARGFALSMAKRFDEAEQEFNIAMRLDPRLYEAHYFYARACFQQGKLTEAARLFEEAAQVREDYQAVFFAAQSHEALGNKDRAETLYRRALQVAEQHMELNPDDPRAATMRAVSLCRLGRLEEGLDWAEQALAIDPDDAGVRYNVACLYAVEGEAEKAIDCLEDAIRVGFGNKGWIEQDPDLAAIREHPRFQGLLESL